MFIGRQIALTLLLTSSLGCGLSAYKSRQQRLGRVIDFAAAKEQAALLELRPLIAKREPFDPGRVFAYCSAKRERVQNEMDKARDQANLAKQITGGLTGGLAGATGAGGGIAGGLESRDAAVALGIASGVVGIVGGIVTVAVGERKTAALQGQSSRINNALAEISAADSDQAKCEAAARATGPCDIRDGTGNLWIPHC